MLETASDRLDGCLFWRWFDTGEGVFEVEGVVGAQLTEVVLSHRVYVAVGVEAKDSAPSRLHAHKAANLSVEEGRGGVTAPEAEETAQEGHFLHEGD